MLFLLENWVKFNRSQPPSNYLFSIANWHKFLVYKHSKFQSDSLKCKYIQRSYSEGLKESVKMFEMIDQL